jgi:hypothetical protein
MPLHLAAQYGHKTVAVLLLASKAEVNAKDNSGRTPLHWAVFNGFKDEAALLLASKTGVNARSNDGRTPLHDAAIGGNTNEVELLLANKTEVNAREGLGKTPLHYAAAIGHEDVAEHCCWPAGPRSMLWTDSARRPIPRSMVARTWRHCCARTVATNKLHGNLDRGRSGVTFTAATTQRII